MEVRYSKHLEIRIKIRGIPHELPRIVFNKSSKHFYDNETDLNIAVLRTDFLGKIKNVMVAYRKNHNHVLLITVHPLKRNQLENRLKTGRWTKI